MRAWLFVLLMLFCLPLQWAGASVDVLCPQEPYAMVHGNLAGNATSADANDSIGQSHAQHTHCGSCHTGVMVSEAGLLFVLSDTTSGLSSGPKPLAEMLMVERPERPQWPTLA